MIEPINTPSADIDLSTHTLTGWPHTGPCPRCGAASALLMATWGYATYECRGTPTPGSKSAYGPDGCNHVFTARRIKIRT